MKALELAQYKEAGKYLVLFGTGLFYFAFHWKQVRGERTRFWIISCFFFLFLTLFPPTALLMTRYQTGRLSYSWIFELVPINAFIAFFLVDFLWKYVLPAGSLPGRYRILSGRGRRLSAGFIVIALLCFLLGNMGLSGTDTSREKRELAGTRELLLLMGEHSPQGGRKFWGPREFQGQMRRLSGKVELFYGRDMWEAQAAVYDLESYEKAVEEAYGWMESLSRTEPEYLPEEELVLGKLHLQNALERGVNAILLPGYYPGEALLGLCLPEETKIEALEFEGDMLYLIGDGF